MKTKTKQIGYKSDTTAFRAAYRMGLDGLSGSGQQCRSVELPDDLGWAYWTAHDYYHPARAPGTLLLRGGIEVDVNDPDALSRALDISPADLADWMVDELGISTLRNKLYAPEQSW